MCILSIFIFIFLNDLHLIWDLVLNFLTFFRKKLNFQMSILDIILLFYFIVFNRCAVANHKNCQNTLTIFQILGMYLNNF